MDIKTVVMGDKAIKVVAEDEQNLLAHFQKMTADQEELSGKVTALEQKLADAEMTPAKLQKMVADRAIVAKGYRSIMDEDPDDEDDEKTIKRKAMAKKLGDRAKDMSDEAISGAFAAFTLDAPSEDPLRQVVSDGLRDTRITDHQQLFSLAGVPMKKG